jgi:hypothetical protein
VHWPFISPDTRDRIVRFAAVFRGGRDAAPPPTLRKLFSWALTDILNAPHVHWNWADRLAVRLHRLIVGEQSPTVGGEGMTGDIRPKPTDAPAAATPSAAGRSEVSSSSREDSTTC